jgi:hypothetical protein
VWDTPGQRKEEEEEPEAEVFNFSLYSGPCKAVRCGTHWDRGRRRRRRNRNRKSLTFPFVQDLVKQFSVGHPGAEEGGGGEGTGNGSLFANFLSALVDIIIEIPVRWVCLRCY